MNNFDCKVRSLIVSKFVFVFDMFTYLIFQFFINIYRPVVIQHIFLCENDCISGIK